MGIVNLQRSSGMHDADQCWALLFVSLGLADRVCAAGMSRESFVALAGRVHDEVRAVLSAGVQS